MVKQFIHQSFLLDQVVASFCAQAVHITVICVVAYTKVLHTFIITLDCCDLIGNM